MTTIKNMHDLMQHVNNNKIQIIKVTKRTANTEYIHATKIEIDNPLISFNINSNKTIIKTKAININNEDENLIYITGLKKRLIVFQQYRELDGQEIIVFKHTIKTKPLKTIILYAIHRKILNMNNIINTL